MAPDGLRTADKHLELVVPMEVGHELEAHRLFDQRHRGRPRGVATAVHPFALVEDHAQRRRCAAPGGAAQRVPTLIMRRPSARGPRLRAGALTLGPQ